MNLITETLDNQVLLFKATVGESDYNEAVGKALRDYRRKANVPGFRPGMVPMGIINKMYRKGVVAEEAYRTASRACLDELNASKTATIGELMPSEQQKELDFDNAAEFEFVFEIGIAPEIRIDLTKKDKIIRYGIKVAPEMLAGYKENFMKRFGKLEEVDVVKSEEALTVILDREDMRIEDAYVGLISMTEEERKPFIGKKVGAKMEINVNDLYKSPSQRASILQVKEEELGGISPDFTLEITQIREFVLPKPDDEFFKTAFPEGDVKDEAEMDKWAEGKIAADLVRETEFKFVIDVRDFLKKKAAITLPDAFLKNWLYHMNEGKFTTEQIEAEYPAFADMMAWDLIQKHYGETMGVQITPEEAMSEAKALAAMQFAYYGMPSVSDDMLENYAKQMLSNREEAKKIHDKLFERKVVDAVSGLVTINEKKVSADEFNKLFEA
ncbi:MAG: trigger factor [Rikenellaceae bacterium]|jgi:trigger factor|nr:trigger factor [Rikenellaceae bacterium]